MNKSALAACERERDAYRYRNAYRYGLPSAGSVATRIVIRPARW